MSTLYQALSHPQPIVVQQVFETAELFGFETRNKYEIIDSEGYNVGFAAEQKTGWGGAIMRNIVGHWRSFRVTVFDNDRQPNLHLDFPFRWFFKRLNVSDANDQPLGYLQQRFAFFSKKFDIFNEHGQLVAKVKSPIWRIWTFEFKRDGRPVATIKKKWSGLLDEMFSDRDNFMIEFFDHNARAEDRALLLGAAIMVDIIYFENNQGHSGGNLLDFDLFD